MNIKQALKNITGFFSLIIITATCFAQQPVISSFSPSFGAAGTPVTITGNNFSSVAANNFVFFGAVKANVTSASTSSLTVTVPFGATYQPLTVTTNGLTGYSSAPFIQTFAGGLPITSNSFAPKIDSSTDLLPKGLAIADYDGDGKPDLATANNYSIAGSPASVSILRNTGSPASISFASHFNIPTGVQTYAIATGDLNGDGKPDLVSSSIVDKTISVFKNTSTTGNISFAPKMDYSTGDNPFSIAIHDIDVDGKPDIVVANFISLSVSVYRNTGSGGNISFAPKVDFSSSFGPRSVAIADLDGDGKPDLAVVNEFSNTVSAFRNTSSAGNISFASRVDFATGNTPYGVAIGDLNNDGKPDLAVSNNQSTNFSTFKNTSTTGTISFNPKVDFPCGANQYLISIGDVNGDAKPDIVIPSANLSVSQNTSTASTISFTTPWFLNLSPVAFATAIVDLDADGKDDIAGAIFTSNRVSLLRNRNNEPVVLSFTPTVAATGATVTITGTNFTGATGVRFGGTAAGSFTVVNNSTITAVVGSGVSGAVEVINQYGIGKRDGFTFAGPPIITSFTPTTTGEGQVVTITGNNLSGATAVSFGGIAASSFIAVSSTTITAVVGPGASGNVSVTTPYGTGILGGFVFVPFPMITTFTPVTGILGTVVTINGNNFSGASAVAFGGTPAASFTVNSNTSITATVGNGASGNVSVTTVFGTATLGGFTFIPAPIITSFTPSSGQTGNVVTITGSNFTGATAVRFGGLAANSFTIVSANTITAVIGSGASGNVSVTGPGGIGSLAGFTFIQPVKITSIMPDLGPAAASFVITGTGFQTNPSANKVTVGSIAANIVSASPTSLTVTAPLVSTNKQVNVLVNALTATSALPYRTSFTAPDPIFSAGSFAAPVKTSGGKSTKTILTSDIDGDGKLDIITGDLSSKVVFQRNTGSGNTIAFAPKVYIDDFWISSKLATADLDGDGKPDIISGNQSFSNTFSIFRNISTAGNIAFDSRIEYPTVPCSNILLSTADMDGDGRIDIIVRPRSTNLDTVRVYRNKSTVGVIAFDTPISFYVGLNGSSDEDLLADDLDGDNKAEIIFTRPNLGCLRNLSTPGMILFSSPITISSSGFTQIDIGDMNDDGAKDIVATNNSSITAFKNQSSIGNISFVGNLVIAPTLNLIPEMHVADLNGDGKPEIITLRGAVAPFPPHFSIFRNLSTPTSLNFAPIIEFRPASFGYGLATTGDMDGDNKLDLVFSSNGFNSDSVYILRNQMGNSLIQICTNETNSIISNISGTTYQWQQDPGSGFVNITNNSNFWGTNTNTLQLINIPQSFTGYQYRCLVDNSNYSTVTSINVNISPVVIPGRDSTICAGSSIQLNSSGGTMYSWSPVSGLSDPNIANPIASPTNTTSYIVTISNNTGCFSKDTVVISVNQPSAPGVIIATQNTNICFGSPATFSAIATNGGTNPIFQWQINGNNVGTNSNIFTSSSLINNNQVKVILTSNSNCVTITTATSNIITLTVDQLATPLVSLSNRVFTVTNPDAAATYTWQLKTNNVWADVVPAATGITFNAPAPGEYRVKAVKAGCTDYSTSLVSNRNVNELNHPFGIYLYPNPNNGILNIDSIRISQKWQTLDIIDATGRLVLTFDIKNRSSVSLDINILKAGTYFAQLKKIDGVYYTVEFVKL